MVGQLCALGIVRRDGDSRRLSLYNVITVSLTIFTLLYFSSYALHHPLDVFCNWKLVSLNPLHLNSNGKGKSRHHASSLPPHLACLFINVTPRSGAVQLELESTTERSLALRFLIQ